MADPQQIDAGFVLEAARLAGIEIGAEQLQAVIASLRVTAEAAALVHELDLDPQEEPGPVWRP